MLRQIFTVTPNAASFATPYSSGDVIGAPVEVPSAVAASGAAAFLRSLVVIDKTNQKSAIDLVFFSEAPSNSVGADNAAYALNDADAAKLLGRVSVAGADYISSGTTNAEATIRNVELMLQAAVKKSSIWVLVVSRGTPTYGAASDLIIKLGLEQ
jgi:hypothetical protein